MIKIANEGYFVSLNNDDANGEWVAEASMELSDNISQWVVAKGSEPTYAIIELERKLFPDE
tara:strand:- start:85 stop:267 length:183 start_codon:yes stop_codon:yes gene_type:complete